MFADPMLWNVDVRFASNRRHLSRPSLGPRCPNSGSDRPKTEHGAEWQAAMRALLLVAEHDGPAMFARIGVIRALNRHVERVFNPSRKEPHWGRRKLARDLTFPHAIIGMSSYKRNHRHFCIRDTRNRSMARETFTDPEA
jgi:hypothetical protein